MIYFRCIWLFTTLLLIQAISTQSLAVECLSRRLAEIKTNMLNSSLMIEGNGRKLIYNTNGSEAIEILSPSGRVYLVSRTNGETINRNLTFGEQQLVETVKNTYPSGISGLIKKCQSIPETQTFKQLMNKPLTPLEIQECKYLVNKVTNIKDCIEKNNCEKMYSQYYENGKPKKSKNFSYQQMIQTGSGIISPKKVAIATGSALGYTFDAVAIRALFKHGGKIVAHAGRLGLTAVGSGAVLISYAIPWTFYLFIGNNKCSEKDLLEDTDAASDCVQYGNNILNKTFSKTLNESIHNPNKFMNSIANNKNGAGARIACSILESLSDQWDRNVASISCQGRTLDFGKHKSYLVSDDHQIYRHKDIYYTYHFDNLPNYRVEKRARNIPDLTPQSIIKDEAEELYFLKPRIDEVINTCSAFTYDNETYENISVEN